jgi:hypothetical protein
LLSKEQMQSMKEDELVERVLMPLLRAMGYNDVFKYHGGSGEQGKDIVCWRPDTLGSRRNLVIIAKAVPLTGQARPGKGTAGEVHGQIQQCFGEPYMDSVTAEDQDVHECWVITNKGSSKEFLRSIKSMISPAKLAGNVTFINGDKLWDLYKKHVRDLGPRIDELQKQLRDLHPDYSAEVTVTADKSVIRLVEKESGSRSNNQLNQEITLILADSPEGQIANQAMEKLVKAGEPVKLPGEAIGKFQLPEVITDMVGGQDIRWQGIELTPLADSSIPPLVARVVINADDGDKFVFEQVTFRQIRRGTEQVVFSNEDEYQDVPVRLVLTLDWATQMLTLNLTNALEYPINAYKLDKVLNLNRCLSKRFSADIFSVDNGIRMFSLPLREPLVQSRTRNKWYDESVEDLAAVQLKLRRPIEIPERAWTPQDQETVAQIRTILHRGGYTTTWLEGSFEFEPEEAKEFLDGLVDGTTWLRQDEEDSAELFENTVPLGVRSLIFHARVKNEEDVRKALETDTGDNGEQRRIKVLLVPADDGRVVITYRDWQPPTEPTSTAASPTTD